MIARAFCENSELLSPFRRSKHALSASSSGIKLKAKHRVEVSEISFITWNVGHIPGVARSSDMEGSVANLDHGKSVAIWPE